MWPRLSIVAGLLTGIAAAALVLGGILLFAPVRGAAPTLAPRPAGTFALPSASASATPSSASPFATPSGSDGSRSDSMARGLESIMPGGDVQP